MRRFGFFTCLVGLLFCSSARAVIFNFTYDTGMNPQAIAGFAAAGARWSALLSDPVTVNIHIGYTSLGAGILGQASSSEGTVPYSAYKTALAADANSANDATAVAHLPSGSAFGMYLNYTSNNPNGAGSATPYLDANGNANNTTINMTYANAKALGLLPANNAAQDATITFSSNFTWDFNPNDGITAGAFDFVGVATHEIGHSLGFISGVDILDINSPSGTTYYPDNAFTYVAPMDLYRFSSANFAQGVID